MSNMQGTSGWCELTGPGRRVTNLRIRKMLKTDKMPAPISPPHMPKLLPSTSRALPKQRLRTVPRLAPQFLPKSLPRWPTLPSSCTRRFRSARDPGECPRRQRPRPRLQIQPRLSTRTRCVLDMPSVMVWQANNPEYDPHIGAASGRGPPV